MINFFLGLVAVAGNLLGGAIVFRLESRSGVGRAVGSQQRALHLLLQLGAGFLLSVTILEMIPAALQTIRPAVIAAPILFAGYLLIYLVENTVSPHVHTLPGDGHAHGDNAGHEPLEATTLPPITIRTLYAALAGLMIHSFFDGVAIGSGAQLSRSLGWLLVIAIVLHKIPEGATVASLAMLAGLGRRAALVVPLILGGATLLGVFFVEMLNARFVGIALGLAAGVTLYISASDLVPHARTTHAAWYDSFVLFIGVALFALTDFLLRHLGLG